MLAEAAAFRGALHAMATANHARAAPARRLSVPAWGWEDANLSKNRRP